MSKAFNIQKRRKLSQFISKYPNKELKEQLQILQSICPNYRPVRGDGNCFYRAFSFLYLLNYGYDILLEKISKLNTQNNLQFSQASQKFKSLEIYQLNKLQTLESSSQKQEYLTKLFNEANKFDEIIINCFRLLVCAYMISHKDQFIDFFESQQKYDEKLRKVRTNCQESEGIEIFAITQALKVKIIVFCIDDKGFQPIYYQDKLQTEAIYIFFRPGHYDIVYPNVEFKNADFKRSYIKEDSTFKRWLLGNFSKGLMYNFWYQALSVAIVGVSIQFLWRRV